MAFPGLLRNLVCNIVGIVLPALALLITIPIYIRTIGTDRYGVVAIAWLLLGYFGFLDFGLSRATANALSRLTDDRFGRNAVIATSFWLNVMLGLAGGVLFYLLLPLITHRLYSLPSNLGSEINVAIPVIACTLPVSLIGGVTGGVLQSREQFLL